MLQRIPWKTSWLNTRQDIPNCLFVTKNILTHSYILTDTNTVFLMVANNINNSMESFICASLYISSTFEGSCAL